MSNWISSIQWDMSRQPPAPYRTYLVDGPGYRAGDRQYVPPIEAATQTAFADPRLKAWGEQMMAAKPGQGFNSMSADATSWDSKKGQWKQSFDPTGLGILGAGAIIGGPALAGAFGGSPVAAAPSVGAGGALPSSTIPSASSAILGGAAPSTAAMGSQAASAGVGYTAAAGGGASILDRLKKSITDPKQLAGLAALLPALTSLGGNNGGPFGDNDDLANEIKKSLALQRGRVEQAQPVYDTLVRMSMGMSPKAYTQDGQTPTPYPYESPRFGGR